MWQSGEPTPFPFTRMGIADVFDFEPFEIVHNLRRVIGGLVVQHHDAIRSKGLPRQRLQRLNYIFLAVSDGNGCRKPGHDLAIIGEICADSSFGLSR
jgi:hypothetical protein